MDIHLPYRLYTSQITFSLPKVYTSQSDFISNTPPWMTTVEDSFFAPCGTTLLATHATSTYYWFFWVNLFKVQNKLIFHSTIWIGLTWPMRSLLQEADSGSKFSFSTNGIITHDIININMWIGLKQWMKAHYPYYLSYPYGKRLLQQEPIFT